MSIMCITYIYIYIYIYICIHTHITICIGAHEGSPEVLRLPADHVHLPVHGHDRRSRLGHYPARAGSPGLGVPRPVPRLPHLRDPGPHERRDRRLRGHRHAAHPGGPRAGRAAGEISAINYPDFLGLH